MIFGDFHLNNGLPYAEIYDEDRKIQYKKCEMAFGIDCVFRGKGDRKLCDKLASKYCEKIYPAKVPGM